MGPVGTVSDQPVIRSACRNRSASETSSASARIATTATLGLRSDTADVVAMDAPVSRLSASCVSPRFSRGHAERAICQIEWELAGRAATERERLFSVR